MGKLDGIEFGLIPEDRYDDVIHHLRHNFFADEPLNSAVSLCRPGDPHAELEEHSLTTLKDGLSQMAVVSETGQIIAVALNGIQRPGDIEASRAKLCKMTDLKFRQIFDLLYTANLKLDLFDMYSVDRIFECRILSVDSTFRGRGLARELLKRSETVARENGFKVFKEDATGHFSQRVAESVGFICVYEQRYEDYKHPDTGEVLFNMAEPHDTLKIMVKVLD